MIRRGPFRKIVTATQTGRPRLPLLLWLYHLHGSADAMKKIKIPRTDSIKELAKFFETHDSTEFEDEVHEVTGPIFIPRNSVLVHLEPRQAAAVKKLAKSQGISEERLVHRWIAQHLAGLNGRDSSKRQLASKARKP